MTEKKETYRLDLEYPYDHSVTLRRSGIKSKSAWEHICQKFGIRQVPPEKIQSITIEGEDDYGRLQISIVAER